MGIRRPPADLLATAGQIGAVGVATLLVPVFTYEHHVVWAIPAVVVAAVAVTNGRISRWWLVPVGVAAAIWATELSDLKAAHLYVREAAPWLASAR